MRLARAPAPALAPALVPLSAAGRQPLFLFGTLTDLDVLTYVLGRPVDLDSVEPAWLDGHRRVKVAGACYPVLVPAPGWTVEGRLLRRATRRDIARLNLFESEEYRAELRPVRDRAGARHDAWVYVALDDVLRPVDACWHPEEWAREHKPAFFARCGAWLEGAAA